MPVPLSLNSRGSARIAIETVFLALDFIIVALRLWARRVNNTSLAFNDYAILGALFFGTADFCCTVLGVLLGGDGMHESDIFAIDPQGPVVLAQLQISAYMLWAVATMLIRLSVLHLYIVIFRSAAFRKWVFAVMGLVVCVGIIGVFGVILQCHPLAYTWDKAIPGGYCFDMLTAFLISAVLNMAMDMLVVASPVRVVWRLQMDRRRKVAVTMIFGLGVIICAITVIRLIVLNTIGYTDTSYTWIFFGLLTTLEYYLGIITASLPLLPSLRHAITKLVDRTGLSTWFSNTRSSLRRLVTRDAHDGTVETRRDRGNLGSSRDLLKQGGDQDESIMLRKFNYDSTMSKASARGGYELYPVDSSNEYGDIIRTREYSVRSDFPPKRS